MKVLSYDRNFDEKYVYAEIVNVYFLDRVKENE